MQKSERIAKEDETSKTQPCLKEKKKNRGDGLVNGNVYARVLRGERNWRAISSFLIE